MTVDLGMPATGPNGTAGVPRLPEEAPAQTKREFTSDQEVRWCPGCGDYAILAAVQGFLPELGLKRENIVFVSGIGCSSRFPYYLDTYGMHSIHGRAPAIATGLATSRPDLSVWVVTGDGDALSIGGNHLIHALRRNVNLTILLFNNQIYGLTKGQYSPTSELGKITKSTPMGSVDRPFNPVSLALGAEATFVARTMDSDRKHLTAVLRRAAQHRGTSLVEIYQNCPIFNDGAFDLIKDRSEQEARIVHLTDGQAVQVGPEGDRQVLVRERGGTFEFVPEASAEGRDVVIHETGAIEPTQAFALSPDDARADGHLPRRRPTDLRRPGAGTGGGSHRHRGWSTDRRRPRRPHPRARHVDRGVSNPSHNPAPRRSSLNPLRS
jgi:2-oxoglutarate ferredoxin oxidoreductase subunit beta